MRGINLIAGVFTTFLLLMVLWGLSVRFNLDFTRMVSISALMLVIVVIADKEGPNEKNKKN